MASKDDYALMNHCRRNQRLRMASMAKGRIVNQRLRLAPLVNSLKMRTAKKKLIATWMMIITYWKILTPWRGIMIPKTRTTVLISSLYPGGPYYLDLNTVYSNGCREALKYAIEKENEKGADLIFERIDHANMHPPGLFFITFEARNGTTGEVKTYQTRVFRCPSTPSDIEVEIFRLKIQPDDK
ncbi:hypothetical protein GH714_019024 [Hevea brasiliensis]|uniref:Cystatin domain-containing protein n=1 Tax=Hevea brasiliensis TaxID=3981 RepID=A0A6A6LJ20_HEVBR|nr:hypothetical protein GH714_019024 [Hevea brasiliensis]